LSFDVVVEGNKIKLQEADSTACMSGGGRYASIHPSDAAGSRRQAQ